MIKTPFNQCGAFVGPKLIPKKTLETDNLSAMTCTVHSTSYNGEVLKVESVVRQQMSAGFREDRLIGATAILVGLAEGSINLVLAQRLLYLLERQSLLRCGSPVFGGNYIRTEDGPFLIELRNQIMGEHPGPSASTEWLRTFFIHERKISLSRPVDRKVISKKDHRILEQLYRKYSSLTSEESYNLLSGSCPEWQVDAATSVFGIKEMLVAGGWSAEDADRTQSAIFFDADLEGRGL